MKIAAAIFILCTTGLTAEITAYCPCSKCCGKWSKAGVTASGRKPVEGVTIAGPRSVPLGTWVHIEGIGYRRVDDRLSKRFDHRWDVFFARHSDAKRFGLQKRKVTICPSSAQRRS